MNNEEYTRVTKEGRAIYHRAKENGLCDIKRWEEGIDHHPKSMELVYFLAEHDLYDMGDYFCWKTGGDGNNGEILMDGNNGEILMYEMDAYFEQKDKENENED